MNASVVIRMRYGKAGFDPDEIAVERAEPNEEGGEQAIQDLLGQGMPFTAVVAYNVRCLAWDHFGINR